MEFISALGILAGIFLYGIKHFSGPLVSGISFSLLTIISIEHDMPWVALVMADAAMLHLINLTEWRKSK